MIAIPAVGASSTPANTTLVGTQTAIIWKEKKIYSLAGLASKSSRDNLLSSFSSGPKFSPCLCHSLAADTQFGGWGSW